MSDTAGPQGVGGPPSSGHRLGPHVVGERIVVRHLLDDGRATDVLGVCLSWTEEFLVVDRDGAEPVRIPVDTIVTGKPVPARASVRNRLSAREVEVHVVSLWDDVEVVELGEWQLRSRPAGPGDRPRKRVNSALAMGEPGIGTTRATDAVRTFYEQRGQTPMVQVQVGSSQEGWFTSLDWQPVAGGDAHCQLASVPRALRSTRAVAPDAPADLDEVDDRATATLAGGAATGRAALSGDWLLLEGLHVDPARRRQGLATGLLGELLDWGASRGARTALLHVEVDNSAAISLYERHGFVTHHTNRYLTVP